jgi:cyclophilin family peptidyl-prolyl cis-trans isomerase
MMQRGPNSRRDRRAQSQQGAPLSTSDLKLTGPLGLLTNKKLFIVASAVFAGGIVLSLFFGILGLTGGGTSGAPMQANEAPDVPRENGTPTASGTPTAESTPAAIKRYTVAPLMLIDPAKKYSATISTTKGDIVVDLYPDQAPLAVNSFVYLANDGYYNSTPFMQLAKNKDGGAFTAQAGDPTRTGLGTPGYTIKKETTSRPFAKGALVMGGSSADSNGGQFFFALSNEPALNGKYTVFGQVTSGQDVLDKLSLLDLTSGKAQGSGDTIRSIKLDEKPAS